MKRNATSFPIPATANPEVRDALTDHETVNQI